MDPTMLMTTASALSDPTRLLLLYLLGSGPKSVGQLVGPARVTQPSVSYHVSRLRRAGLVFIQRLGRRTLVRRNERRWQMITTAFNTAE